MKATTLIRSTWVFYVVMVFVSMMAGVTTASAGTLDVIKDRGVLVAGVKAQYPPFGFVNSSGKHLGFDIDLAHQFAKALFGDPDKVKFVSVTSGNRIPYLQSKKIDIIMASMTVTDARKKVVDYAQPYFYSGSLILVPKDSDINGVDDLAGKTVAVIQGSIQVQDVGDLAPEANLVQFGKVSQAVLAVKTGRADAYVHDDIVILAVASEHPELKVVGKAFRPRPLAIAVRKGDTKFLNWVNGQLTRMKKDGTFDKIWRKWFGEYEENLVKPD